MPSCLKRLSGAVTAVVVVGASLTPSAGWATVISARAEAYGEAVSLTTAINGIAGAAITSGPLPSTSFNAATSPTSGSNSAASASVAVSAGRLSTGLMNVSDSTTVNDTPGSRTTTASATVNNLNVGLLALLGLTATTVQSTTLISGDYGALQTIGTSTITGLTLNGAAVNAGSTPNFVLLNNPVLGVQVMLNEQVFSGNGISTDSLTVNAIDIKLANAVLGGESLNGSIIIGQSVASEALVPSPVPEPGSLAMSSLSIALLSSMRRKGRVRN